MRRTTRFSIRLGILAGLVLVARRLWLSRQDIDGPSGDWSDRSWVPPTAPGPAPAATAAGAAAPSATPAETAAPAAPSATPAETSAPAAPSATPAETSAPAAPSATPAAAAASAEPGASAETGASAGAASTDAPSAPPTPSVRPPSGPAAEPATTAGNDVPRIWVEPVGGTCPPSHLVKAKLASRLFHVPGMFAYDRTRPDRCYADESDAIAEGFSKAKR